MRTFLLACTFAVALGVGWGAAQDPPRPEATAPPRSPDEAPAPSPEEPRSDDLHALRQLVARFADAYNAGDADALADLFAEQGEVVGDDGTIAEGREAIADRFAAAFADDPGATLCIALSSLDGDLMVLTPPLGRYRRGLVGPDSAARGRRDRSAIVRCTSA